MNKIKEFFQSIGMYFKSVFVSVDGNQPKLKSMTKSKGFESLLASVIAALLGMLVGLIIMLVVNPQKALEGFAIILGGGLKGGLKGVGDVFYYATPILMTGLSVGFAFKTGLFNIGASGQYTMGMFFTMYVSLIFQANWFVCMLAGMLGGMLWGAIPGIFKALLNVNEVITSIMTNYIGMFLIDMLIMGNPKMYNSTYNWTQQLPVVSDLPKWGFDKIFPYTYANAGFIVAMVFAILIFIVLNKTTFGYELRACGTNKFGAKYAGINEKKNIILSMVIAGGLAGIGGALYMLSGLKTTYSPVNALDMTGFNGIAVALLGVSNPIGTIFSSLFFAHIKQGGFYMQSAGFKSEIIDIIVGVIIYFSAFALIIKNALPKLFKRNSKKLAPKIVEGDNGTNKEEK